MYVFRVFKYMKLNGKDSVKVHSEWWSLNAMYIKDMQYYLDVIHQYWGYDYNIEYRTI